MDLRPTPDRAGACDGYLAVMAEELAEAVRAVASPTTAGPLTATEGRVREAVRIFARASALTGLDRATVGVLAATCASAAAGGAEHVGVPLHVARWAQAERDALYN